MISASRLFLPLFFWHGPLAVMATKKPLRKKAAKRAPRADPCRAQDQDGCQATGREAESCSGAAEAREAQNYG
jgi:hypothetical protein